MVYYQLSRMRERLNIRPDDETDDQRLNNYGKRSDAEIDNELYNYIIEQGGTGALPTIPLTSPPQEIRDASSDRAEAYYKQDNPTQDDNVANIKKMIDDSKAAVIEYAKTLINAVTGGYLAQFSSYQTWPANSSATPYRSPGFASI